MIKKEELIMHKLLDEHDFEEIFNKKIFEKEKICKICRLVVNTKPANTTDEKDMMDAFRYGMVSIEEALETMGIFSDTSVSSPDVVLPMGIDKRLTIKSTK